MNNDRDIVLSSLICDLILGIDDEVTSFLELSDADVFKVCDALQGLGDREERAGLFSQRLWDDVILKILDRSPSARNDGIPPTGVLEFVDFQNDLVTSLSSLERRVYSDCESIGVEFVLTSLKQGQLRNLLELLENHGEFSDAVALGNEYLNVLGSMRTCLLTNFGEDKLQYIQSAALEVSESVDQLISQVESRPYGKNLWMYLNEIS